MYTLKSKLWIYWSWRPWSIAEHPRAALGTVRGVQMNPLSWTPWAGPKENLYINFLFFLFEAPKINFEPLRPFFFFFLILTIIISIFTILINNMQWTYSLSYMRNAMFIIRSQQSLSGWLLLTVIDREKSSFSSKFKLELIKMYNLKFVRRVLWKCCKCNTSHLLFSC